MKSPHALSRRSLLKTLGAGAAASPFFELLRPLRAEAQTQPLRLLVVFNPHGTLNELWRPKGGETDFNLVFPNSILAPLEKFRSKILVLDGIDYRVLYDKKGHGHEGALCTFLTGTASTGNGFNSLPYGPSIDQVLAEKFGGTTKFRSLELGVYKPAGDSAMTTMCYAKGGLRLPNQIDPATVYQRLFSNLSPNADVEAAKRELARKKSVLNYAVADTTRMKNRLSVAEKAKLDQHLQALSEIERRLVMPDIKGCSPPGQPAAINAKLLANVPTVTKLQMDLIAQAFACDLTRFASLQLLSSGSDTAMPWVPGLNKDIHVIAHKVSEPGDVGKTARLELGLAQRWWTEQIVYLLERLELAGVLENTLVVWGNELGDPAVHDQVNIPIVLAGGAGGAFRMGRYLKYSLSSNPSCVPNDGCAEVDKFTKQTAHNKLLVSICRAFGHQVDTFGDPDYVGELPNLV